MIENKQLTVREVVNQIAGFLEPDDLELRKKVQGVLFEHFNERSKQALAPISPKAIFWGLGERAWMQMIDGCFHHRGALVFDEGRPKRAPEPGYLQNMMRASQFAAEHMEERLTLSFYKKLHALAAAHLDIPRGEVVQSARYSKGRIDMLFPVYEQREMMKSWFQSRKIKSFCQEKGINYGNYTIAQKQARQKVESLDTKAALNMRNLQFYVYKRSVQLGESVAIATFERPRTIDPNIQTRHCFVRLHPVDKIELFVEKVFDEFETRMIGAQSKKEKLQYIADLYQVLEWHHPFQDGQGRTDWILLSMQLCRHGFNPAILETPGFCLYSQLDPWVEYLKNGMSLWRQEHTKSLLCSR